MQGFCKPNYSRLLEDTWNGIKAMVISLNLEKGNSNDKNIESFKITVLKFRGEGIEAWARKRHWYWKKKNFREY